MAFSNAKFMKQKLEHSTESISVPALAEWFGDDEPVWMIRSLTGTEFIKSQEAQAKNKNIQILAEALAVGNSKEKVDALKSMVGTGDDVPAELAKRIEMFVFATVSPVVDMELAVKMAEFFPSDFMIITNKIINLTARGADMVKPKPSGKANT